MYQRTVDLACLTILDLGQRLPDYETSHQLICYESSHQLTCYR